MRSLLFVFLAACGGGATSTPPTTPLPPATPADPAPVEMASSEALPECKPMTSACAIQTLDVFSNRMCGCKDKACADKVNTDMTSWGQALANDETMANTKPSESEAKRATEVMTKYAECMTKLMADEPAPENPCG